jgi:uncharacterized membrane protein
MEKLLFNDKKSYIFYIISLSSIIGFIENFFPKILIFTKIGMSNIPILLVFDKLNFFDIFLILILKSFISAFFSGTLLTPTFLLSIAGSLGSFFGYVVIKITNFIIFYLFNFKNTKEENLIQLSNSNLIYSIISISIFLSFFSNFFQLIFYMIFLLKDIDGLNFIPIISIISIVSGYITGYIAYRLKTRIELSF